MPDPCSEHQPCTLLSFKLAAIYRVHENGFSGAAEFARESVNQITSVGLCSIENTGMSPGLADAIDTQQGERSVS